MVKKNIENILYRKVDKKGKRRSEIEAKLFSCLDQLVDIVLIMDDCISSRNDKKWCNIEEVMTKFHSTNGIIIGDDFHAFATKLLRIRNNRVMRSTIWDLDEKLKFLFKKIIWAKFKKIKLRRLNVHFLVRFKLCRVFVIDFNVVDICLKSIKLCVNGTFCVPGTRNSLFFLSYYKISKIIWRLLHEGFFLLLQLFFRITYLCEITLKFITYYHRKLLFGRCWISKWKWIFRFIQKWLTRFSVLRTTKKSRKVFNSAYLSIHNVIKCTFKVWKVLQNMSGYSYKTQVQIVVASITLHNYIRKKS